MKNGNLARNTIILSLGTIFSKGLQFIMLPFVSRWLTTEAYGRFDLIVTYVTLLLPVITLATGEAVFRFTVSCETKEEQKTYVTNGFLFTTINLIICICVIWLLSLFGILSTHLLVYFFALLIAQLYNHYFQAFLRGIKRLPLYTASSAVTAVITTALTVVLVHILNFGLEGLLLAYATGYMSGNMVTVVCSKFWSFFSFRTWSGKVLEELIRYSFPLVPNDISWWILSVSDRQVIALVLGTAANGIYAMANKVPALCSTVFGMFSISWQQSIVERITQDDWPGYANQIYNQILVFLLTLCSGILSATFILFQYLFDIQYEPGMVYVPILVTAVIFSSLMMFLGGIQIALKQTAENGITTVIGAVINLAVDILLVHTIGLYAAAISTLVANMATMLLRQYRLRWKVLFVFEKKTILCMLFYVYFVISSYILVGNVMMITCNILLAGCIFIVMNRQLIWQIVKR